MKRHELPRPRRSLARIFRGHRNRRITSRRDRVTGPKEASSEDVATKQPRLGVGARLASMGRRLGRAFVATVKVAMLISVLAGLGLGAYLAYQHVQRSTYFNIDRLIIKGTRHALPSEVIERIGGIKGQSIFDVDLDAVARAVQGHAWIKRAKVLRQLPRTIRVEVEEHRVEAVILLDGLYLVSASGVVFKRATIAEAEGVPLITGITRKELIEKSVAAKRRIKEALAALSAYHQKIRPALSEVHIGVGGEVTFFLRHSGTALRFGKQLSEGRLRQLDAIWVALGKRASRARALYFDHEVRRSRVVVRMADGPGL